MKKLLNLKIPYSYESAIRIEKLMRHSSYIKEFVPTVHSSAQSDPEKVSQVYYAIGPLTQEGVDRWIAQFAEALKDNPFAEYAEFTTVDVVERV